MLNLTRARTQPRSNRSMSLGGKQFLNVIFLFLSFLDVGSSDL